MSFSSEIKQELLKHLGNGRHCMLAELAALVNNCGDVEDGKLKISADSILVVDKASLLIQNTFNVNASSFAISRSNEMIISDELTNKILAAIGLTSEKSTLARRISPLVVQSNCCKRAYIRGTFISLGSLTNPEKAYHLEFVFRNKALADGLLDLLQKFEVNAKITERIHTNMNKKTHVSYVVYIKESENISDLLNIIEAHNSLLTFENARVVKDVRNNVNRRVNSETYNLTRTVEASVHQVENINYIVENKGMNYLTAGLREIAELRLDYPDISLDELGKMLTPPISKSGVNHRLRKIGTIAKSLKNNLL